MDLIVAVDENWGIGQGGDQLVYIPADLKRFQAITMGRAIILGRKTLSTFPACKPLKGRRNMILSRDETFSCENGEIYGDARALLAAAPADAVVVGGASVYKLLLGQCERAYVTKIEKSYPADCWFENLDEHPDWRITDCSDPQQHEGLLYRYLVYERN